MATVALSATEAEYSSADRFLVNLHFDIDTLLGDDGGVSEIEGGATLSTAVAEYLACDGACIPVLDKDGMPFDLGRKTPAEVDGRRPGTRPAGPGGHHDRHQGEQGDGTDDRGSGGRGLR